MIASSRPSGRANRSRNSPARCRPADANPMRRVFVAAMREWKPLVRSQTRSFAGLQMRIEKVDERSIAPAKSSGGTAAAVLATVGSAVPFVGLFRNRPWQSFRASRRSRPSKNTSLAVCRPASRKRLFATANRADRGHPREPFFYNSFTSESESQGAVGLEGVPTSFQPSVRRSTSGREDGHDEPIVRSISCITVVRGCVLTAAAGVRRLFMGGRSTCPPMVDGYAGSADIFMVAPP